MGGFISHQDATQLYDARKHNGPIKFYMAKVNSMVLE